MIHLPTLIQDLGFILIIGAIVTLIFKKLKQPVVLGYLIAGFLVGPHVPLIPNVQDIESVKVWAEIGVIVLLFGLGLEFSFKKLAQTGRAASITAIFEVIFMLLAGFAFGKIMGWSNMDSLFLGGILSISSTAIIIRAFEELGLKGQKFVSLVFGVLVVEDIVAVLLLVLLSTMAISQNLSGTDLALSSLRLFFFITLWFVVGIYALPLFMRKIKKHLNDETTLVVSLGLCLLMVIIATKVGFSAALGAFVMGSLLAETSEGPRIEKLLHPIKDLFAAVFFVSVGMMIEPQVLFKYAPEIILITVLTISGKLLSTTIGAVVSGIPFRKSIKAGMSLAQIGEFSFIIATLGLSLKVTSDFLYPIAVSVSALTTFATPYLIKSADSFSDLIEQKLPASFFKVIEKYQAAVQTEQNESGLTQILWRAYGWKTLINGVLVVAIISVGQLLIPEFGIYISFAITCLVASPFVWAFCLSEPSKKIDSKEDQRLHKLDMGIYIIRSIAGFALALYATHAFIPLDTWEGVICLQLLGGLILFGTTKKNIYYQFESRFLKNLNPTPTTMTTTLWDTNLTSYVLHPNSVFIGKNLIETKLKEYYNITIAIVERGYKQHIAPEKDFTLMPHDKVFLIGSDESLQKASELFETSTIQSSDLTSYQLESFKVQPDSELIHKTIRTSQLREKTSGLVVGIERNGQKITNPDSNFEIWAHDILWIVGDHSKIKNLH